MQPEKDVEYANRVKEEIEKLDGIRLERNKRIDRILNLVVFLSILGLFVSIGGLANFIMQSEGYIEGGLLGNSKFQGVVEKETVFVEGEGFWYGDLWMWINSIEELEVKKMFRVNETSF